jgi:anaerobic selenocysteine-containing dehydrogenase
MPSLTDSLDEPAAHIHPDTAAELHIHDGDQIRLATAHDSLTIAAVVTDRVQPGVVAVPQFWGHTYNSGQTHARRRPGVNINRLHTTSDIDQFTGMPIFNGRPCTISQA